MKKLLGLPFLFLCTASFATHFPICMYGVNEPADIPLLKEAGFTCVQHYQRIPATMAAIAQTAQDNQMQVVFYPKQVIGSAYEKAAQNWPVLAWYLVDEPDVWKWSRERVQQAHEQARAAFPNHQTTLVIGQGKTAVPYYDLSDTLMMDWYPVPHLALTSFGDNVRWAKEGQIAAGVEQRPLWAVVQAFDWKEYKQHRPDNDRIGRFPTEEEIRFMSYDGIVNGADGLFYFIFTAKGIPLPKAHPLFWQRIAAVSQEIAALRPVFEQGTPVDNPVQISAPLAARSWVHQKYIYTILVNRSDQAVPAPKAFLKRKYMPLFGTQKEKQLPPYAVWILQRKK